MLYVCLRCCLVKHSSDKFSLSASIACMGEVQGPAVRTVYTRT